MQFFKTKKMQPFWGGWGVGQESKNISMHINNSKQTTFSVCQFNRSYIKYKPALKAKATITLHFSYFGPLNVHQTKLHMLVLTIGEF